MDDILRPAVRQARDQPGDRQGTRVDHRDRRPRCCATPSSTAGPPTSCYVSDFDPAGDSMPVAVARQAQFWADQLGIGQRITVQPVALTRAQVRGHALPPIPIKTLTGRARTSRPPRRCRCRRAGRAGSAPPRRAGPHRPRRRRPLAGRRPGEPPRRRRDRGRRDRQPNSGTGRPRMPSAEDRTRASPATRRR